MIYYEILVYIKQLFFKSIRYFHWKFYRFNSGNFSKLRFFVSFVPFEKFHSVDIIKGFREKLSKKTFLEKYQPSRTNIGTQYTLVEKMENSISSLDEGNFPIHVLRRDFFSKTFFTITSSEIHPSE